MLLPKKKYDVQKVVIKGDLCCLDLTGLLRCSYRAILHDHPKLRYIPLKKRPGITPQRQFVLLLLCGGSQTTEDDLNGMPNGIHTSPKILRVLLLSGTKLSAVLCSLVDVFWALLVRRALLVFHVATWCFLP